MQDWLEKNRVEKMPASTRVINRQFADNGVFAVCSELAEAVPSLAEICLSVKGLQFKKSWDIWAQTPRNYSHPDFKVRKPEEGLVVLGGLVHSTECTEVEVLVGTNTFLSKHVETLSSKIEGVSVEFEKVVQLAAQAHHAERICFKVFANTMKQRVTYFLRVFPPEVSAKVAERLDDIFRRTTAKILGWTEAEVAEAASQAVLHPEDGGHGASSTAELAPLLHLASWLSTTHEHSSKSSEIFAVIPLAEFFEAGEFSQKMQNLYLQVRKINDSLPDSFENFVKQILATKSFMKRTKSGKKVIWQRALAKGMREVKIEKWKKSASDEQRERVQEMKGNWIFQEPPVSRGFSRKTWLIAMRFRYGLSVEPVFSPRTPSSFCVSQRSSAEKTGKNFGCCATPLDSKGRHAVTCHIGGKTIIRHDAVVRGLAELLKPFVISCATEVYIHELEKVCAETGKWTEAKLDLDVVTRNGRFLLDVSVFHPFQKVSNGKMKHVQLSEREKKKFERYPTHKNGQRVTDAALVPIILNTFGAIGDKATEFLYAVAGAEAKRICDEISLLSVFLSADMILQSHAPSNLSNLLLQNSQHHMQPAEQQLEVERTVSEENGFLRPDLRGEVKGDKVQCTACACVMKNAFFTASLWHWNRHVQRKHTNHVQPEQEKDCGENQASPSADHGAASEQRDVRQLADKKQSAPRCSAGKSRAVTKVLHLPAVQPPVQTALQQQDVPVASQSTKGKRASAREPKQGSVVSPQVRTPPSPNHSSSELQAGKRTKQISTNPAHVKKSVKRSKTFPVENASNVK